MQILDTSRHGYDRAQKLRKDCFFCDANLIKKQNCTQFEYLHWYVLVNKHPYQNGNVMIVPKRHLTKLSQLSEEEWQEYAKVIVSVQKALTHHFDTDSFNVGLNEGKESGRSVAHLHWQVIPRKKTNYTAVGIFADIHVVTLPPDKLKKMLSK
jgi:ATP adenylyltransferase